MIQEQHLFILHLYKLFI